MRLFVGEDSGSVAPLKYLIGHYFLYDNACLTLFEAD
jgi:hypothetical protein